MRFNFLLIVIINFLLLSCSGTDEVHFDSDDDGYLIYNDVDSLKFDQDWNLITSTASFSDSISLINFENDTLMNIYYLSEDTIYTIQVGPHLNPLYIQYERNIEFNPPSLGSSIQYSQDSVFERLNIDVTFLLDGHIKAYVIDHKLIYKNNEIDTSRSLFYRVEESDSGGVIKIYNELDINKDYYCQVTCYSDPFLELSPASKNGKLYVEDSAKIERILYFKKGEDAFIFYDNIKNKPTVIQVFVVDQETLNPLYYYLGVIRPDFSSEKRIALVKNDLSKRFKQFKNKSYLKDIDRSLEGFPFVSMKSQGVVEIDKGKLKKLYSNYKDKK